MKWSASDSCRGYYFFESLHATGWFLYPGVSKVNVTGRVETGRHPEHLQDFPVRSLRNVLNSKPHTHGSASKTAFDRRFHLSYFTITSCSSRGLSSWQEFGRVVHCCHSRCQVPNAYSVVNESLPISFRIPAVYISGANLQFKGSCYPIHRLETIVLIVLSVLMQINKAGRHSKTARVNHHAASQFGFGNCFDCSAGNANVSNAIQV